MDLHWCSPGPWNRYFLWNIRLCISDEYTGQLRLESESRGGINCKWYPHSHCNIYVAKYAILCMRENPPDPCRQSMYSVKHKILSSLFHYILYSIPCLLCLSTTDAHQHFWASKYSWLQFTKPASHVCMPIWFKPEFSWRTCIKGNFKTAEMFKKVLEKCQTWFWLFQNRKKVFCLKIKGISKYLINTFIHEKANCCQLWPSSILLALNIQYKSIFIQWTIYH